GNSETKVDDPRAAPAGSTVEIDEHRIWPNEPTTPSREGPMVPNEPALPAGDPGPQQDPAGRRRNDSPPPESARATGEAIEVWTDPAPTPARTDHCDDPCPAPRRASPGQRSWVHERHFPGGLSGRGNPGA